MDRTTTGPRTDPPMTAGTAAHHGLDLRRLSLRHLLAAAVLPMAGVLIIGVLALGRLPAVSPTAVGNVAPDFALTGLDGDPIQLSDLRGQPVIVNFWASWCGPCVEEFPLLRDAADRHAADGLVVVGIVYQDRSSAARGFMERMGAAWPTAMDPDGRVAAAYGILGPPETFFIGRDGTIVARQLGQFSATSLDEKVAAIMDEE